MGGIPADTARTTAALLALRGQVIAHPWPESAVLGSAASPRTGPLSIANYETLRIDMQTRSPPNT